MAESGGLGELAASPLLPHTTDQILCVHFDTQQEGLWAGTESGVLGQVACPTLERYSSVPCHEGRVLDLRSVGEGALSVSSTHLCLHASGGVPRLFYKDEVGDLACVELEGRGSLTAAAGREGGGITLFDLASGRPSGKVDTAGKSVVRLCGPVSRGVLAAATADGYFSLLDPRAGGRLGGEGAAAPLLAHPGGFAALDGRGNFVATAGYATRMGRLMLEAHVKVFDVRMAPRMLSSVPFAPGPTLVKFHPKFGSTLLVGSAGGVFTLADAQGLSLNTPMYQVDAEGDALLSCSISTSGECIAFGGSGGYLHLWASSQQPSVCGMGQVLPPPDQAPPLVSLGEDDPLSAAPIYFSTDGTYLSDVGSYETASCGLAPRVVDPVLLKSVKQSDFVAYIPNPRYRREAPPGASARAAAPLRCRRVEPRPEEPDPEAARAERARRRAAAGGIVLPGRYRRVAIRQAERALAGGLRFEEFDFSFYNRTPFAGLENDLANCYTNALLQVLFFTLPVRDAMMRHVPDLSAEFSLAGELSFLFRMMAAPGATICQASNLLRALRQSREAVALGLVEGVRGERGAADIEVEAHKERSLARRVQSLARFVLEQLHKEGSSSAAPRQPGGAAAAAAVAAAAAAAGAGTGSGSSVVMSVYSMTLAQRTQCLSRKRPDLLKETHTFQVDLQYPSAKDWPNAPPVPTPNSGIRRPRASLPPSGGETAASLASAQDGLPAGSDAAAATTPPAPDAGTGEAGAAASSDGDAAAQGGSKPASSEPGSGHGSEQQQQQGEGEPVAEGGSVEAAAAAAAPKDAIPLTRPRFSDVLKASLLTRSEMRAWFDDTVKYQFVRQERVPVSLPQLLVLNCGLKERSDLRWWQPYETRGGGGGRGPKRRRSWLPPAIAVTTDPSGWVVEVEEGDSPEDLLGTARQEPPGDANGTAGSQGSSSGDSAGSKDVSTSAGSGSGSGSSRAVYVLTAVICHIQDEDEMEEGGQGEGGGDYEGHLIAHIRVPPPYYKQQQQQQQEGGDGGAAAAAAAAEGGGAAAAAAAPLSPGRPQLTGAAGSAPSTPQRSGAGPASAPASPAVLAAALLPAIGGERSPRPGSSTPQPPASPQLRPTPPSPSAGPAAADEMGAGVNDGLSAQDAAILRSDLATMGENLDMVPASRATPQYNWMVFNDFHITLCREEEVGELFGGQKAPCLLYYTQVDLWQQEEHAVPAPPAPVLTPEGFLQLCKAPPLQGPRVRLHRPSFTPLGSSELPHPGMLLALDAEFVAYSPPDKRLRRGVEVEVRPSRLGLARVSVVRGTGPTKGTCCIDDYIRGVEPVYDYLTKYSGLVPGDLDAGSSPHYLTTLRRAYAKLRYLVDAGCVFVGHGLKKDFRMINIVVPQSQMVDTVDLFHAKRSRKLSLRFLASYLLRANIQTHTHDSIEDACTALRLYEVYQRLVAEGEFGSKLQEMYTWGKVHGWDPVVWVDGKPHPAPQQQQAGMGAAGAGTPVGGVPGGGPLPGYGQHHLGGPGGQQGMMHGGGGGWQRPQGRQGPRR